MFKKLVSAGQRLTYGASPDGGPESLEALSVHKLDGEDFDLDSLDGKVVLFVNVASRCGLTPQYAQLAELQKTYGDRGFTVIGSPCNQFLGQEPGSAEEIQSFCSITYGIDFPLLEKQEVNGAGRSPLYQFLIGSEAGGGDNIAWNFEKFLVGRDGTVLARFAPKTLPDAPKVIAAIEAALA
ncbi:MAG: glutathione peroxidase [Proteobacteria bacterium]|nr:glutathione peroxidase [Pseudomonadota bacterium]